MSPLVNRRTPPPHPSVRWREIGQAVVLVCVMGLCYARTLDGGFFWDDRLMIPADAVGQSLQGLKDIWGSTKPYDYYPVTYTAFWAEWQLWGDAPLGYHLVGLALGLLNVFLLWAVLHRLRLPGAWLGPFWFAIHPVGIASVAWIAEQKNTFSLAFCLLSVLIYVRAGGLTTDRIRLRSYLGALGWFVLAVLSKSSVVVLPCVLLLLTWWKQGRIGRAAWFRSVPFFAVSLAAGLGTIWFHQHRALGSDMGPALALPVRLSLPGCTLLFYLGKTCWPFGLSMIYPRWHLAGPMRLLAIPTIVVAGGVTALWLGRERWGRGPLTAAAYFVAVLLPVSGLLTAAVFKDSFVYDHLMYLALAGTVASMASGLTSWQRTPRGARFAPLLIGLVTAMLMAGSWVRADDFTSAENLWRSTLAVNPQSATAANNLGLALQSKGRLPEAEAQFRRAVQLDPRLFLAATNLANTLQQAGQWRAAAAAYEAALSHGLDAKDLNNYGVVCLQLGETVHARSLFKQAATVEPRLLSPRFNLGKLDLAAGDCAAAVDELAACLRIDPDDVPSLLALAKLAIQTAPARVIPPAAVTLAKRADGLVGTSNPLPREILEAAAHAPPGGQLPPPEITLKIERSVRDLPLVTKRAGAS